MRQQICASPTPSCPPMFEVKRQYDPDNLFRVNHNIRPN
jgi:hypothetical protein